MDSAMRDGCISRWLSAGKYLDCTSKVRPSYHANTLDHYRHHAEEFGSAVNR